MDDREPDEVCEIDRKNHLHDRPGRFERPIFARPPRLRPTLDAVLGRAREIGSVINQRLQHRARIVE